MKRTFPSNIGRGGRAARAFMAFLLILGAAFTARDYTWLAIGLTGAGGFLAFEALRGWCVLRACGIKTPI